MSRARDIANFGDGIAAADLNDGAVTADKLDIGQVGGRRNLIINGAMQVAQRATSKSVSNNTNEGYSTVDRYLANFVSNMGGGITFEQATAPSGTEFSYAAKFSCTTTTTPGNDGMFEFPQRIEGQNLQHLKYGTSSAESLTLSFWVYTNKTGKYGVALRSYDGTNTDVNGQVYEVTDSNTWQKITLTYTGNTAASIPNNNGIGMYVEFYLAAGSNRITLTSNTWSDYSAARLPEAVVNFFDSTSNVFYITGIQLEVGSVATPFEHRSYGEELALCNRYYKKTGFITRFASTSTNNLVGLDFGPMRAEPSVTRDSNFWTSSESGTSFSIDDSGAIQRLVLSNSSNNALGGIFQLDAEL